MKSTTFRIPPLNAIAGWVFGGVSWTGERLSIVGILPLPRPRVGTFRLNVRCSLADDNFGVEPMANHARGGEPPLKNDPSLKGLVTGAKEAYPDYGYRKIHALVNMLPGTKVSTRQIRKHLGIGKK
jgi:hypothetical protein